MASPAHVAGCAFHVPTGDKKHVFIMTFDPWDVKGRPPQSTVVVSISTVRDGPYDVTCILEPGCHRVVIARSYAVYRLAALLTAVELDKFVKGGVYCPIEPFEPAVVERVRAGILASPHTRYDIKDFVRARQASLEAAERIAAKGKAEPGQP